MSCAYIDSRPAGTRPRDSEAGSADAKVAHSMSKRPRALTAAGVSRPGEGFPIETVRQQVVGVDGTTGISVGVDLGQAPVPDRRYVVDLYSYRVTKGGCQLLFAQQKIGKAELRSLLVLHMTATAAGHLLRACVEMRDPSIAELAKIKGLEPEPADTIEEEPDQTVALNANLAGIAVANEETCLDFYQMSAATIHAARHGGQVHVNPVVRVELRTSQFLGLLEELQKLPFFASHAGG